MRTLTFEQITDSRFDNDCRTLISERVETLKEALDIDGVEVETYPIRTCFFPDGTWQCRCRFAVRKTTREVTWNDIYCIVNSVKAVPYKFV